MTTTQAKPADSPVTTAHSEMRDRARVALEMHQEGLAVNQTAVDNALTNRQTFAAALAQIQERRTVLLSDLHSSQAAVNQAQAAYVLATGTPVESERAEILEQSKEKVAAVHTALQALAEHAEETEARQAKNEYAIEAATEQRDLARADVDQARAIFDEVDLLHRNELTAQLLEDLATARSRREKARQALQKAEEQCATVQAILADTLQEWPAHAAALLLEHGEFASDPNTRILELWRDMALLIEDHAAEIDQQLLTYISPRTIPIDFIASNGKNAYPAHVAPERKDYGIRNFEITMLNLSVEIESLRARSRKLAAEKLTYQR